ncbi:hypothetical protein [Nodularia sp. NIES-3585]|uniref:hypothetical protein n=1 Tax=Nodularia sp. NIES-3585 TaxID=1973477 RepID=UPI000B5C6BCC|nr:hypothetical protein [Nodularia sp. NIES-3585]GAX38868.1 hypothetical protein NIES3585_49200 [Nodularia sp. NIES-3585]
MAKGFGAKAEEQLGYTMLLVPEVKAYAARFSLDYFNQNNEQNGEEFIGITSMLEEAQIWKSIRQVKQAIEKYADFLISKAENGSPVRVEIRRVKRSSSGDLINEPVEEIFLIVEDDILKTTD